MKRFWAGPVLLMLVFPAACYRVAGRPYENVRTVSVSVFTNKTLYRDVDFDLTDEVGREINALTFYTLASPEEADAVLEGEVSDYAEKPEAIDENEVVTTWRLVGSATYKLVDNRTGETLAGPQTSRWSEVYPVRTGRTLAEVRKETFRKLAQKIVEQVFMPWPDTDRPAEKNQ